MADHYTLLISPSSCARQRYVLPMPREEEGLWQAETANEVAVPSKICCGNPKSSRRLCSRDHIWGRIEWGLHNTSFAGIASRASPQAVLPFQLEINVPVSRVGESWPSQLFLQVQDPQIKRDLPCCECARTTDYARRQNPRYSSDIRLTSFCQE